jgi:uncharacterized protein YcfJ
MNRSMIAGIVVGAVAATSLGAFAGYRAFTAPTFAEVVGSTPVKQVTHTREQACEMVPVTHQRPVKDEHQLLGTAAGAVLGGVIGHQIGGGRGRDVATVAGVAAGGYAGNRVQKNMQDGDTYTTQEKRCRTVERPTERVVGYDVQYTLGGKPGQLRMDHPPPERIPVRDGRLVLDPPAPGAKG